MKHDITLKPLPGQSKIVAESVGADFADCYCFADPQPESSAMETYLVVMGRVPGWMNFLMSVRNQAVRLVGLKHLGGMQVPDATKLASAYQVGERIGIFSLAHIAPKEVIVYDNDKHLKVQISVFKHRVDGQAIVSVSTVVHNHNRLGRLYMAVVGPVHQLIVPKMLSQALHAQGAPHQ